MNTERIKEVLDKLIPFGVNSNLEFDDNIFEIKKVLIELYSIFTLTEDKSDENDYNEDFDFSYKEIRKVVESNFPKMGYYTSIRNCQEVNYKKNSDKLKANLALGDPIDDISDIIKDMMEVKWRFENTSEEDAIWHFKFLMNTHSEIHLVDLLKYLKDSKG